MTHFIENTPDGARCTTCGRSWSVWRMRKPGTYQTSHDAQRFINLARGAANAHARPRIRKDA